MATRSQLTESARIHRLGLFLDRWFYVGLAAYFVATAIAGFSWSSSQLVAAVAAGQRPMPPITTHVHAFLAASWLLLALVQTTLVATGRSAAHRRLGTITVGVGATLAVMSRKAEAAGDP